MRKMIFDAKEAKHVFFTSDTHFGHINILKYCNRPFENIEEHDEELIKRWNNKVGKDDIVFHLGEAAGQTIPHLHIHVIPRYNGDVEDPRGGVRGVIPDKQKYKN